MAPVGKLVAADHLGLPLTKQPLATFLQGIGITGISGIIALAAEHGVETSEDFDLNCTTLSRLRSQYVRVLHGSLHGLLSSLLKNAIYRL